MFLLAVNMSSPRVPGTHLWRGVCSQRPNVPSCMSSKKYPLGARPLTSEHFPPMCQSLNTSSISIDSPTTWILCPHIPLFHPTPIGAPSVLRYLVRCGSPYLPEWASPLGEYILLTHRWLGCHLERHPYKVCIPTWWAHHLSPLPTKCGSGWLVLPPISNYHIIPILLSYHFPILLSYHFHIIPILLPYHFALSYHHVIRPILF